MATPSGKTRQRKYVGLALALVPPAAFGAFVLWTLHHPNPRVRAPVPLTRNSLLPHRYAGPCINCHVIIEVGPAAINSANMSSFPLSPVDRQLLLAGQRVDVPALSQKISIPAITRTDGLPHPYVGVCSNCHVVLDVHPSPAFMKEAMSRAGQPLSGLNLGPLATARGGAVIDDRRAAYRRAWGYAALALLALTAGFMGMRVAARRHPRAEVGGASASSWLTLHQVAAAAFCGATAAHWYYSDRGNNFLHLAILSLCWLTSGGLLLRFRLETKGPSPSGRGLLAHTQWFALFGLVALLLIGHFFGDFD